jgi:enoyl-CoA hydratase
MPSLVLPSRPCQHVRVLAINRPEKRNALSQALIDRLLEELGDASRDDAVRVIVVTGTDTLFCGMGLPNLCVIPASFPAGTGARFFLPMLTCAGLGCDRRLAGADIQEIAALDSEAANQRRYLEDLCNGFAAVKKPLIAAVEGIAVSRGFVCRSSGTTHTT